MSDDWVKKLASKISGQQPDPSNDDRRGLIIKYADEARQLADRMLFEIFTTRLDAIIRQLDQAENRGGFLRRFRKAGPSVLRYQISPEENFRFQLREALGARLEVEYERGSHPVLRIDVATAELIEGNFLPIFRESGAVAGAQIWREKRSENKHPELVARLMLILSAPALEDGLKVKDAIAWFYEDSDQRFTVKAAEELIETLIGSA